jgi:hypothetical protein
MTAGHLAVMQLEGFPGRELARRGGHDFTCWVMC